MKTDELIEMLSTNVAVEHRDPGGFLRVLLLVVAACILFSLTASSAWLGIRTEVDPAGQQPFLALKIGFCLIVIALALGCLDRAARPGASRHADWLVLLMPFGIIFALAGLSLGLAPASHWQAMMVGDRWLSCLISIPIIEVVPFAAIFWTVRRFAAPTDLTQAGAVAGMIAGAVSAVGYAIHCVDDSIPFVALWYGGMIVGSTAAGAVLGRTFLRW